MRASASLTLSRHKRLKTPSLFFLGRRAEPTIEEGEGACNMTASPHLPTREITSSKLGNGPASIPLGTGGRDDGAGNADRAGSPPRNRSSKSEKLQASDES